MTFVSRLSVLTAYVALAFVEMPIFISAEPKASPPSGLPSLTQVIRCSPPGHSVPRPAVGGATLTLLRVPF